MAIMPISQSIGNVLRPALNNIVVVSIELVILAATIELTINKRTQI